MLSPSSWKVLKNRFLMCFDSLTLLYDYDYFIKPTPEFYETLWVTHLSLPIDAWPAPNVSMPITTDVSTDVVLAAIECFRPCSIGGIIGFWPGLLNELTWRHNAEGDWHHNLSLPALLTKLHNLDKLIHARNVFFSVNLTFLR